jgi:hypothetical protein
MRSMSSVRRSRDDRGQAVPGPDPAADARRRHPTAEEGAGAAGLEFIYANAIAFVLRMPEFEAYLQARARERGYSELSNKDVADGIAKYDAAIARATQGQEEVALSTPLPVGFSARRGPSATSHPRLRRACT